MRVSDFIFDSVQLIYHKCHKVNFRRYCSYIDSLDLIKQKKTIINSKNENDKYFQYTVTVALNYGKIKLHPERVLNNEQFITGKE